eukprot:1147923-Pelagomonas_calceolata.AAC.1
MDHSHFLHFNASPKTIALQVSCHDDICWNNKCGPFHPRMIETWTSSRCTQLGLPAEQVRWQVRRQVGIRRHDGASILMRVLSMLRAPPSRHVRKGSTGAAAHGCSRHGGQLAPKHRPQCPP